MSLISFDYVPQNSVRLLTPGGKFQHKIPWKQKSVKWRNKVAETCYFLQAVVPHVSRYQADAEETPPHFSGPNKPSQPL